MKKLFIIGASLLSIFTAQGAFAGCCGTSACGDVGYGGGNDCGACQSDCGSPCDQPTNNCYCQYVRYQPYYYSTKRCVQECVPCSKKCCRWVPQYYQVQRCRYVPEYYCETRCKQVCEYYDVPDCKYYNRVICEPQCTYIPQYYWKYSCGNNCGTGCCP